MFSKSPSAQEAHIVAEGIGKSFPPLKTKHLLRQLLPLRLRPSPEDFWALKDISFELGPGRVLGVVGRNGSGKSTLLQIVAGLMRPSQGRIHVQGNVAALLELGAGFNPDFSGIENVMLSGKIYGFSREYMNQKLEEIIEFADIGDHIHAPVKTYSSGMFARLAFAVSIAVRPSLLLVDEILSVGDVAFQARCYRRIEALKREGTSILFVSHDLNAVQMLCDEAILLNRGTMVTRGHPKTIAESYLKLMAAMRPELKSKSQGFGESKVTIRDVKFLDEDGHPVLHPRVGFRYKILAEIHAHIPLTQPVISLQLKTMQGFVVYDFSTLNANCTVHPLDAGDVLLFQSSFVLHVCPGPFRLGIGVAQVDQDLPVAVAGVEAIAFEAISEVRSYGTANLHARFDLAYKKSGASSVS